MPPGSTKAEQIVTCLNQELAAYGFKSYVSPDRSIVLLDDETMAKVFTFFKKDVTQPYLTNEHVSRVKSICQVAKNNQVDVLARTSLTGAAPFTIGGAVALSWSASIMFATVENYIPNDYRKIKAMITGAKWVSAIPIRFVEWTANGIFGFFERQITDTPLPINITETYRLQIGPKVEDLPELRKSGMDLTMKLAQAKEGGN